MYVTHLACPRCGSEYDYRKVMQLCQCGAPLLVKYDVTKIKDYFRKTDLIDRPQSPWRYYELLPIENIDSAATLGEVMTPLIQLRRLGQSIGLSGLYLKDEGLNPGGTFKARGAAIGVAMAEALGVKEIGIATTGNAGAAWARYCAQSGIRAYIVMPVGSLRIAQSECFITGAKLYLVEGLICDAAEIVSQAAAKHGWLDVSALKEPYRIEGKKTIGFEIAEQFNWKVPDVILCPTGSGIGIIGIYKALAELRQIGWIGPKLPRLVAVQSAGCAPLVKAWKEHKPVSQLWKNSQTIAFSLNVPKTLGDFLVLEALYMTNGRAIEVNDEEILFSQAETARTEGLFICPEGAAALAAVRRLKNSGWVKPDEKVVVLNIGSGLKHPDNVKVEAPTLKSGEELITKCH